MLTAKPAPNGAWTDYYKYFALSCPDVLGKRAGAHLSFPERLNDEHSPWNNAFRLP